MTAIVSWNVNGVRAAHRHGFLDWLNQQQPDVCCIQEIKAIPDQVPQDLREAPGYSAFWMPAERKGYSGVGTFTRQVPDAVEDLGVPEFDREGRVQILHFPTYTIVNAYFPNSQENGARLDYKLAFCDALLNRCSELRSCGKRLLICGDYNIAHRPIDLANPKNNERNPGYLPQERDWMSRFLDAGYVDTFRMFNQDPGNYTWWTYRFDARTRNVGWRIDYHCVSADFREQVLESMILNEIKGSDHCPVLIRIQDS